MLRATDLVKKLGGRPILDGLSLDVHAGQMVAIMGRSGSGKSTLVNVLAGLDGVETGAVNVAEQEFSSMSSDERAEFRLGHIGIVFQHFNLLPDLTVAENVALPLSLAHRKRAERVQRAEELMDVFDIRPLARRFPEGLSGGELQRVAVARALANRPAVVLADEPTANLDDDNARSVVQALLTAAKAGAGVIVASHDELVKDGAHVRWHLQGGRLRPVS